MYNNLRSSILEIEMNIAISDNQNLGNRKFHSTFFPTKNKIVESTPKIKTIEI